jgi:hypothetical protein
MDHRPLPVVLVCAEGGLAIAARLGYVRGSARLSRLESALHGRGGARAR